MENWKNADKEVIAGLQSDVGRCNCLPKRRDLEGEGGLGKVEKGEERKMNNSECCLCRVVMFSRVRGKKS